MTIKHRIFLPFLGAAFFLLTGFSGTIDVREPLQLDVRKGRNDVMQGEYTASVNQSGSRKLIIEIDLGDSDSNPVAEFIFPRGKSIPATRGVFELPASESGQNYDLSGAVDTILARTADQWEQRSCVVRYTEWRCWIDARGYRHCYPVTYDLPGFQNVRYYDQTKTKTLGLDLIHPETSNISAIIDSSQSTTDRIYTYSEPCRRY